MFVAPLQLLESVFSVLFPSECRLCQTSLNEISRIPVCRECLAEIRPTRVPQCILCGDRLPPATLLMGDGRCWTCRDSAPEFDRALSFGEYLAGLRGLIHLLKYEGVTPVAAPLGRMLARTMTELAGSADAAPLVIPVPLHKSRRRSRGFNQAELLARAAVRHLPLKLEVLNGALVRQRDTVSQVGLSREERIQNVRDAFRVAQPSRVKGRDILLVDDVMTTGTTLSECARVLKRAGAQRVWAATVARAFEGASPTAADPREQEDIEVAAATLV